MDAVCGSIRNFGSVTIEYCVSNVIFLWILTPVFVKKLNRVKYKYGFFKDEEVRKLINQ